MAELEARSPLALQPTEAAETAGPDTAVLIRPPQGRNGVSAALSALRRRVGEEWRATALYDAILRAPAATGFAARPRDPRPVDSALGRQILSGRWPLADGVLETGAGGDPFDRASPSRRFAVELHRFGWLHALLELEAGPGEALRQVLAWRAVFDRPSPFAWGAEVLERRVFNFASTLPMIAPVASEAEAALLAGSLARQTKHLLNAGGGPARRAERLAAVSMAGVALAGAAGERLMRSGLSRLGPALNDAVQPDGSMRTRSAEQGLELLLDLLALDDGLLQRGGALPEAVARAMDRLGAALQFHTLADGRLPRLNGGGAADPQRVAAALEFDDARGRGFDHAPQGGLHRLVGRSIEVMADAGPPPDGAWSVAACAQPLAVEVLCGGDRLITNAGWTPDCTASAGLRLTPAGSTVSLGDGSAGRPASGRAARALGPRIVGGAVRVDSRRKQNDTGVWLELSHDGWAAEFGLVHERRLYLDLVGDELRGEDAFVAMPDAAARARGAGSRSLPYAARFHLAPGVRASLARDGRSVLLRGASDRGWWFRNDASDVEIAPAIVIEGVEGRRAQQIVLSGRFDAREGGRVRWKLSPVEPTPPPRLPLARRDPAPEAPSLPAASA